jgi:hypothetical protein
MEAEHHRRLAPSPPRGETVALMANSTDSVARLNQLAQQAPHTGR